MEPVTRALVAELGKKTGVSWLRYDGRTHAVWHVWLDDAMYLLSGDGEQPLPGIEAAERVEVLMRSKENGGRLVTWVGRTSRVAPGDEAWEPVSAALLADRLNVEDLTTAVPAWAERCVVTRVEPTGEVIEEPGDLSDGSHAAVPAESTATTRGPLPRVLHRRVSRRPHLS